MHRTALCVPAAFAALCLFGSPSRATIDMALDTSNYQNDGTAFTASVNGVIDDSTDPSVLVGATIVVRFDTTKVSISDLHTESGSGWSLLSSNTLHTADGWVCGVLYNTGDPGQTEDGPVLQFTVTPANSTVDPADCDTLKFSGSESDMCDDQFNDYLPSDPCAGIYSPPGQDEGNQPQPNRGMGPMTQNGSNGLVAPSCEDLQSAARILRIMGGLIYNLSGDPNNPAYPVLTQQNQATLETVDPGPGNGYLLTALRHFTWNDVLAAIRLPSTGPDNAVWTKSFVGNTLDSCGKAANSTAMPALSLLKPNESPGSSNPWVAAFPMGTINGTNYYPAFRFATGPNTSHNTNAVYLLSYLSSGVFDILANWPQKLADGPEGVALAKIEAGTNVQVLANNSQDEETPSDSGLFSRLYVWNSDASGVPNGLGGYAFPFTNDPTNTNARGYGHAAAAPVIYDLDGDGVPEILFSTQGQTTEAGGQILGGIQMLEPDGTVLSQTQVLDPNAPWYTLDGPNNADFYAPPALGKVYQSADRFVAGPANPGLVYGWDKNGGYLFQAQTDTIFAKNYNGDSNSRGNSALFGAIATGDVIGDGHSEIVAGSGNGLHYYTEVDFVRSSQAPDYHEASRYNDGFIYCWSDAGERVWRYPEVNLSDWNGNLNGRPAFACGVAIGRLRGNDIDPSTGNAYPPCIVSVDASGRVVALKGEVPVNYLDPAQEDADRELWTYQLPQPLHRYYQGVVAQPLILDVNNDGYQDVIIGTTHGEVYILDGHPPTKHGRLLDGRAPFHTFRSSDSVWPSTGTPNVEEFQYEEVRGMGVAPLKGNSAPNNAILLVTSGRAGTTGPNQVGGHAMLFDLGANSWNAPAADWPQYQQNAQRTGTYPG